MGLFHQSAKRTESCGENRPSVTLTFRILKKIFRFCNFWFICAVNVALHQLSKFSDWKSPAKSSICVGLDFYSSLITDALLKKGSWQTGGNRKWSCKATIFLSRYEFLELTDFKQPALKSKNKSLLPLLFRFWWNQMAAIPQWTKKNDFNRIFWRKRQNECSSSFLE